MIKRRTEVAGIFPNENAVVRLIGAILLERNEEWAVHCARYDNGSSRRCAMIRASASRLSPADLPGSRRKRGDPPPAKPHHGTQWAHCGARHRSGSYFHFEGLACWIGMPGPNQSICSTVFDQH